MYKYRNIRNTSVARAPSFCFALRRSYPLEGLFLPLVGHYGWLDFVDLKDKDCFHEMHLIREYNGPEIFGFSCWHQCHSISIVEHGSRR
jgi:hypothetical protein